MEKITANTEVSTSEMAAVLGITARRTRQLVEDGVFISTDSGKLNLSDCVKKYIAYKSQDADTVSDKAVERSKAKAEAALKQAKAEIAQLEAQELHGKMHRSEDVQKLTDDLIYAVRSTLMAMPGRLAVDVVGAGNANEAAEIIRAEIYKVLEDIANYEYSPDRYAELVRKRMQWSEEGAEDE